MRDRQNFLETPSTRTRTSSEPVAGDELLVTGPGCMLLLVCLSAVSLARGSFYFLPATAELRSAPHSLDQMRHGDAEADKAYHNDQH